MENYSLFDNSEQLNMQSSISCGSHLDVVKMEYIECQSMTWEELFSGFDYLHAITYSSGIDFIYKLLDFFDEAEIIFGCQDVMSYSLQEIMAFQDKTLERMREIASQKKLNLISRIGDGNLKFYVARTVLSHEKVYLLSAKDGRKRVIMGSANLSRQAFSGFQRENISYIDGERAYEWYMDCYKSLRENSSDQIDESAFACADSNENLEELPISKTVRTKKIIAIETAEELKEEVEFALDVKNLAKKLTASLPVPEKKGTHKGKILLSPEKIKSIRRQAVAEITKEKELRSEYPQLEVFPMEGCHSAN